MCMLSIGCIIVGWFTDVWATAQLGDDIWPEWRSFFVKPRSGPAPGGHVDWHRYILIQKHNFYL